MAVTSLPDPGVTAGGAAAAYKWAEELNAGIESRYLAALAATTAEASTRATADAGLQTDVNTRKQRIAYAEDVANTAIALGNGVFTALQPSFSVPPSTDDVTIRWAFVLAVTAAGAGSVTVAPADVTSGAAPSLIATQGSVAGSLIAGLFSSAPANVGEFNFGPSATWRTFRMYGFVGRDVGSTLAASLRASGTTPFLGKTFMEAVLG